MKTVFLQSAKVDQSVRSHRKVHRMLWHWIKAPNSTKWKSEQCIWDLDSGLTHWILELVRNMVFFELFPCYFSRLSMLFYPPRSFLSVSLFQEKTKHVLLIPWRSRAQRTTTMDDPFPALSKRPSLWVVLQVHLPLVGPRDLPQQDVSLFTR